MTTKKPTSSRLRVIQYHRVCVFTSRLPADCSRAHSATLSMWSSAEQMFVKFPRLKVKGENGPEIYTYKYKRISLQIKKFSKMCG